MFCYQKRIFVFTQVHSRATGDVRRQEQRKKMREEINDQEDDKKGMKERNCKRRAITTKFDSRGTEKEYGLMD